MVAVSQVGRYMVYLVPFYRAAAEWAVTDGGSHGSPDTTVVSRREQKRN